MAAREPPDCSRCCCRPVSRAEVTAALWILRVISAAKEPALCIAWRNFGSAAADGVGAEVEVAADMAAAAAAVADPASDVEATEPVGVATARLSTSSFGRDTLMCLNAPRRSAMGRGDGDMREESRAKQIRGVERSREEWRERRNLHAAKPRGNGE